MMNFQFATDVFDRLIAVFSKLTINSAFDPTFIFAAD